jgi:hypothetical protein
VNEDALSPVSNSRSTSGSLDDVDEDDEDELRKDMERRNLRGGDESSRSGL